MKKVWTQVALAVGALTFLGSAQASALVALINFETAVATSNLVPFAPLLGSGDEFYQPGFAGRTMYFDPFSNAASAQPGDAVGAIINDPTICAGLVCPTNNPSTYVGILNDAVLAFGSTDGFRFSIKNFRASFLGNGDTLPTTPGFLRLQGVRDGVSTNATFALGGPDALGNLNFATFNTSGAFANTEFDLVYAYGFACPIGTGNCSAFSTDRAQFAIDDITIEHVPEPGSLALLGLAGFAAFAVSRRRSV